MDDQSSGRDSSTTSDKKRKRRFFFDKGPKSSTTSYSQADPMEVAKEINHRRPIDLEGYDFDLSEDAVFKEATIHNKFELLEKYSLTGLPRFDGLSSYNITDDTHDKLLKLEIKRLIETAKSNESYVFDSKNEFKHTSTASFEELSVLAYQISTDSLVISLDNCTMVMDGRPKADLVEIVLMTMKQPYSSLRGVYVTDEKYGTDKVNAEFSERSRKLAFALVEYITGSIARLLVRTAAFTQWNTQHLALLAQLAVKLKVLSKSPKEYALLAMERAEETIASYEQAYEPRATIVLQEHVEGKGMEEKHLQMNEDIDLSKLYFLGSIVKRNYIHEIFQSAVSSLHHTLISRRGFEDFHHHTVAYETGFDRSLVVVSEDRNGFVSTTSAALLSKMCCRALSLVKSNVEKVHQSQSPPSSTPADVEPCTITLNWAPRPPGAKELPPRKKTRTSTMKLDHVISIMVPLALATPLIASTIEQLLQFSLGPSSNQSEELMRRFKYSPFEASCSIQTSTNAVSQKKVFDQTPDTVPINRSGLIGRLRAGTEINSDWGRTVQDFAKEKSHRPGHSVSAEMIAQYAKEDQKMNEWVFATTTVTVRCKLFVTLILSFCAFMVTGALVLPFFVKNKLPGVDPFQITTFTWLVVGVILVTAKGRYVKEWPWHDFVHGRVVCDSINDLADVTGVNKQTILMKLLHNERSIALMTKGPYNGMFDKRSEGDTEGFAIDEPVRLSTMLASGFIVLKVISHHGEHLICLDARKKSGVDYANSNASEVKYLSCVEMPNNEADDVVGQVGQKPNKASRTVLYLSQNGIGWHKLIGLFVGDAVFG